MGSLLEALQIELVDIIASYLELCDIASLRLTSRTIETKASQGCFNAFFKQKKVELTTTALQDLIQATGQGHRGRHLQHCTIIGIIRNETAAQDESTEHVRLLTEAFCNLKQWSPEGRLASLCLRVVVRIETADGEVLEPTEFRSWSKVWDAALRTFHVATTALHDSQLPLNEHLDVFSSLRGCSLSCSTFLASTHIFRSLKKLTISLSDPYEAVEHLSESWHCHHILPHILHILPAMPELASLDLHWYDLHDRRDALSAWPALSATFRESNASSAFLHLNKCSLRGIYVSESDLLQFLKTANPVTVTLTDIFLVSGTYTSIFQYLTNLDSRVTCYNLDDVHERNQLVHFEVPGDAKFPYKRDVPGPSSLIRQEGHVKEAIRYRFARGRALGSPEKSRWCRSKAEEFGPVQGAYNFIALNSLPKFYDMEHDASSSSEPHD